VSGKDPRYGLKVGDRVKIGSGFMGRCWNEGLVGEIVGFDDPTPESAERGAYSTARIKIDLEERAGCVRLSKMPREASK